MSLDLEQPTLGRTAEQAQRDMDELRKVRASRGWQLYVEALQRDLLIVANGLADTPDMPVAEIHFRRGRISAARSYASILDVLIQVAENEVVLAQAETLAPPTTNATA